MSQPVVITNSVQLDASGRNVVLDGRGSNRIFEITGAQGAVTNLVFSNGTSEAALTGDPTPMAHSPPGLREHLSGGPVSSGTLIGALAREARRAGWPGAVRWDHATGRTAERPFFDPWIAARQRQLLKGLPHLLVNIAAFAWAGMLSALAMLAPLAPFWIDILMRMR